jgi:predicted nucleic acid-binding protein
VPLVVHEESSARIRQVLQEDAEVLTWAWTRVELAGAIERRFRAGALTWESRREHLLRFESLAAWWDEVTDLLAVRTRALALLAKHPLRAADAGHLAAALLAADSASAPISFVSLDERLSEAAEREGLSVPR